MTNYELEQFECLKHNSICFFLELNYVNVSTFIQNVHQKKQSRSFFMRKTTFNQLNSFNIKNRLTWLFIRETKTYSSSLMRFFYFSQVWWDLVLTKFTSRSHQVMSRSRQIWWVARNLMRCDYLSCFWIAFNWWIAFNLMKCNCLSRLIKSTYVARQVKNEHTSFVRLRLNNQNIDDEMIKQNHKNESSQTISVWKNLYRISQITSHTIENESSQKTFARENLYRIFRSHFTLKQDTKHVIKYIFAINRFINIYRNNEFFR